MSVPNTSPAGGTFLHRQNVSSADLESTRAISDSQVEHLSMDAQAATNALLDPMSFHVTPDTTVPCPGQVGTATDPNKGTDTLDGALQAVLFPCFGDFTSHLGIPANNGKGATVAVESSTNDPLESVASSKCGTGTTATACGTPLLFESFKPNVKILFNAGVKASIVVEASSASKIFQNYAYAASLYDPLIHKTLETVNNVKSNEKEPHSIFFSIAPPNGLFYATTYVLIIYRQAAPNIGNPMAFSVPKGNLSNAGFPGTITGGADGNVWFTEAGANAVGKVTTAGEFTVKNLDSAAYPEGIALGPDGNLWVGYDLCGNDFWDPSIARVSPALSVTEFNTGVLTNYVAPGPDGRMWFLYQAPTCGSGSDSNIGSISVAGSPSVDFSSTDPVHGTAIVQGPDREMWVTQGNGFVGKLAVSDSLVPLSEYKVSGPPSGITAGPDGNIWFTEPTTNKIGKITTAGKLLGEYPTSPNANPVDIVAGPDGDLWFTEPGLGRLGRITTGGVISEYHVLGTSPQPTAITAGPDGNIWYNDPRENMIGRITP